MATWILLNLSMGFSLEGDNFNMRMTIVSGCLLFVLFISLTGCKQQVSFSENVMPILEAKCVSCHAVGKKGFEASGLSVETYEQLMKGTREGPVIEPGYSYFSTLQIVVEHRASPSASMPRTSEKLSSEEIQIIGEWIDEGARNN
jgi:cytochrome c553